MALNEINPNENHNLGSNLNQNQEIWIKCEFCGFEYKKCDGISCEGCPINCKTIKCPNCGYEILPESKSYKFMEDTYKKLKNKLFK